MIGHIYTVAFNNVIPFISSFLLLCCNHFCSIRTRICVKKSTEQPVVTLVIGSKSKQKHIFQSITNTW